MSFKSDINEARAQIDAGNFEEALSTLDYVLDRDDEFVPALLLKCSALRRLKKVDESVAVSAKLIELQPKNVLAWRSLLMAYHVANDRFGYVEALLQTLTLLAEEQSKTEKVDTKLVAQLWKDATRFVVKPADLANELREFELDLPSELLTVVEEPKGRKAPGAGTASAHRLMVRIAQQEPVHRLLESVSPKLFDSHTTLTKLVQTRAENLDKALRLLEARQRNTVGVNVGRIMRQRRQLVQDSRILDLLRLQISTNSDDSERRVAEADLLERLVAELRASILASSADPDLASTLVPEIAAIRAEIADLSERMAMFPALKPLAFELTWDRDNLSEDAVIHAFPKLSKRQRRASKGNTDNKSKAKKAESKMDKPERELETETKTEIPGKTDADAETDQETRDGSASPDDGEDDEEFNPVKYYRRTFQSSLSSLLREFGTKANTTRAAKRYQGDSVLGWRLATRHLIRRNEYAEAVDAAHSGQLAIERCATTFWDANSSDPALAALRARNTDFQLLLAQAYIHHEAPKNWALAESLFDEVLATDAENVDAVFGKGLLAAQTGRVDDGLEWLEKAEKMDPSNTTARREIAWLHVLHSAKADTKKAKAGDSKAGSATTEGTVEWTRGVNGLKHTLKDRSLVPGVLAETSWRLGYAYWTQTHDETLRESSYEQFVAALAAVPQYAPAYTYLGLFYADLVGDTARAERCFRKALELDPGELIAGERLATSFAAQGLWPLVEVVANTVLSSSRARSQAGLDWPYRALGIASLNRREFAAAVKYFQRGLRGASGGDVLAWVGLGEAYIHSGRYRSAEKALQRALRLRPDDFSALYVLSVAQRATLQLPAAKASIQCAIDHAPMNPPALQWALADNAVRTAEYYVGTAELQRAREELVGGLEAALATASSQSTITTTNNAKNSEEIDILLCSAVEIFLLLHTLGHATVDDLPAGFDTSRIHTQLAALLPSPPALLVEVAAALAVEYVARTAKASKPRRVSAHALAARSLALAGDEDGAAVQHQAAIALEPRNAALWAAYGTALAGRNARVAQHCLVRSLSLDGRNADTWVALAGLYLQHGDAQLALEAVDRALSLEPEHARAWAAQALAEQTLGARGNGHLYRTFLYARELSRDDDALVQMALAVKEYEILHGRAEAGDVAAAPAKDGTAGTAEASDDVNASGDHVTRPSPQALGALEQLLALRPDDKRARRLLGLLLERAGLYEQSAACFTASEDWTHAARAQLAAGRYDEALTTAARAESEGDVAATASPDDTSRLSVLLTSGLAAYFLGDLDAAIAHFTEALTTSDGRVWAEDVLRLLVEVLWASGDDEAIAVAEEQLFGHIETHGSTLQVTLLLGAIGFLHGDAATQEAVLEELRTITGTALAGDGLVQASRILQLLDGASRAFQRATFLHPTEYGLWRQIDKRQALIVAEGQATELGQLSLALVEAHGEDGADAASHNLQRAVFLDPTSSGAWNGLAKSLVA